MQLRTYFTAIAGSGLRKAYFDPEMNERRDELVREQFEKWLSDASEFLQEELLFIPEPIASAADRAFKAAIGEDFNYSIHRPFIGVHAETTVSFREQSAEYLSKFNDAVGTVEKLIRAHLRRQQLQEASDRVLPNR